jgi:S-adenosylmethionine-diacylgycerolhomoserine-N-methlytransferase
MDATTSHASLMDGVYRYQRHIYDITRKYYLLGRDRMIEDLAPPSGGTVLEVGCGTGRNLIAVARRYPQARLYGFDISAAMLETARVNIAKAGLAERITLAQGDATAFDPQAQFSLPHFDRVFFSYTLSMVPDWRAAIGAAFRVVAPGGRLHLVDFGQQERLPKAARAILWRWLALFHVTARATLRADVEAAAPGRVRFTPLYRGYAWLMDADGPT